MTATRLCTKCNCNLDSTSSFCASCGTKQTPEEIVSPLSGVTAWVLCIFLGHFGAHRFYAGKIGTALLMLFTFGGLGIWYVYDYYSIPCRNFKDSQGRVLVCQRNQVFPIIMSCLISLAVLFYVFLFSMIGMIGYAESKLEDIASKQFSAIQANKIDEAYSYEAPDTISSADFAAFIKQHPEFVNSTEIKFPSSKYTDFSKHSATLEAQLITATGEKTTVHYEFKKIDKEWKIVKIELIPPTTPAPVATKEPSSNE